MKTTEHNPYAGLSRIFHEPNRLAIVSALGGAIDGLSFNELKDACALTDGNLSRHLKTLEASGVIRVKKSSSRKKTCTRVVLADHGREKFIEYLEALEAVLVKASESVAAEEKAENFRELWKSQFGTGIFDMD